MSDDINEDGLQQIKDLMGPKYEGLVDTYVTSTREHLAKLREGLQSGDAQMIVDSAHPMKSSSGNMGLVGLGASAAELEQKARDVVSGDGDIAALEPLIAKIESQYEYGEGVLRA